MSHVDAEQLAGLALDPRDGPPDVREHVATCPECAGVVAAFTGARRRTGADALVAPPSRLRERVLAEVRAGDGSDPLPGAPFHSDQPEASEQRPGRRDRSGQPDRASGRRGVPMWLAGIAAALALLAGVGLGRIGTGEETPEAVEPPGDTGTVVAAASLTALDSDAQRGEASAVRHDDIFTIRVSASELGDEPGVREVWLINVDGKRMISIGLLAAGDEGEFAVPMRLIDEGYRIVDISIEPDDGDPTHSGVSLARGELA
ncbi:anti-sigma factor [Nocardioides sp. zg-1228]|uniref:anti-sigma factor n=1 Tax=Nocardioides sp. zg-1228 TaxID=2763008 RepID=UPI001642980A|nr:anti-sigma factor [Nocardioides sp. zg-1228]MBC2932785.1 anti-sigma factor [Nocardioides sp. zg-1228]QSF58256.1 anti-sigma factor [Nocardioides sp. zg-1228]